MIYFKDCKGREKCYKIEVEKTNPLQYHHIKTGK